MNKTSSKQEKKNRETYDLCLFTNANTLTFDCHFDFSHSFTIFDYLRPWGPSVVVVIVLTVFNQDDEESFCWSLSTLLNDGVLARLLDAVFCIGSLCVDGDGKSVWVAGYNWASMGVDADKRKAISS